MTEFVQLTQCIAYLSLALTAPVMTVIAGVFAGTTLNDMRRMDRTESQP